MKVKVISKQDFVVDVVVSGTIEDSKVKKLKPNDVIIIDFNNNLNDSLTIKFIDKLSIKRIIILALWEVFSICIDYKAEDLEFVFCNFISTEIVVDKYHNDIEILYQEIKLKQANRKTNIGWVNSDALKVEYLLQKDSLFKKTKNDYLRIIFSTGIICAPLLFLLFYYFSIRHYWIVLFLCIIISVASVTLCTNNRKTSKEKEELTNKIKEDLEKISTNRHG